MYNECCSPIPLPPSPPEEEVDVNMYFPNMTIIDLEDDEGRYGAYPNLPRQLINNQTNHLLSTLEGTISPLYDTLDYVNDSVRNSPIDGKHYRHIVYN